MGASDRIDTIATGLAAMAAEMSVPSGYFEKAACRLSRWASELNDVAVTLRREQPGSEPQPTAQAPDTKRRRLQARQRAALRDLLMKAGFARVKTKSALVVSDGFTASEIDALDELAAAFREYIAAINDL